MATAAAAAAAAVSSIARGSTVGDGRDVHSAAIALGERLATLRAEADASLQANPPGPTWLPEGCEDAPPEIMQKLVEMTAGAGPHPPHPVVDALWISMAREALVRHGSCTMAPKPWALRAGDDPGAGSDPRLGTGAAGTYLAERLARLRALEAALAAGMPAHAPPTRPVGAAGSTGDLEVYATHLTNDDYILGAEVLAASLVATGTTRPMVALVTNGVSTSGREGLQRAGWTLVDVELAGVHGEDTPQARGFFSKIWLWALPVHSVVYIDTDVLVLDNLDGLFQRSQAAALAAVPDSQPHMDGEMIAQTGLLVVKPSPERFTDLWEIICGHRRVKSLDDWKQFEQGFFTIYFDGGSELDTVGGGCGLGWQELPPQFNFCVRYCQRPLYRGLSPSTTSMVHFACAKPWDPAQRNYAPPAYTQLYLAFAKAAGIPWRAVDCAADRARERENEAKMQRILREQKGG